MISLGGPVVLGGPPKDLIGGSYDFGRRTGITLNHFKIVLPISLSKVLFSELKIEILPRPHS